MFDDEEEGDAIQEDQPTPAMGWTTKVWYKSGCESSVLHHRLMGILQTYYADWDAAMEYVCEEQTHPLEDTYWKTRACISIRDEEKEAYQLDLNYTHWAHCATIEDSIEDAASEACMGLRGHHPKLEWAIMDPKGIDPTTQVMVNFACELVEKNRRLKHQLKAQEESLKRYQQVIDDQRECLSLLRIYEKLPHKPRP